MRSRVVAGLAVLLFSLSCSENPTGSALKASGAVANELETVDELIVALFPQGLETAALQRWSATEDALARDSKTAQRHMMQLADFALTMQGQERLEDPDGSGPMSVNDGVLKLIALMFGTVNPDAPQPPTNLGGDFVVAVVDGSHQTVVTPSHFAGVEFPAGAAADPFLLVVRQTPDIYDNCKGPLNTSLCQYPRFYDFTPYPYSRLTKQASFGVCVLVDGSSKAPSKEVDDRLRLAHDAPADAPRDGYQYVPAAEGRGIEILPYVQTKFLDCHRKPPLIIGGDLVGFLENLLLPAKAYAIDLGGGGQSDAFSNFNVVDPGPRSVDSPEIVIVAPPGKKPRIPRDQ
jgi:hypothetical protein